MPCGQAPVWLGASPSVRGQSTPQDSRLGNRSIGFRAVEDARKPSPIPLAEEPLNGSQLSAPSVSAGRQLARRL